MNEAILLQVVVADIVVKKRVRVVFADLLFF